MTTEKENNERILREGKSHVTFITFTVTKDGDDYSIGDVMAERHEHSLGDEYLWSADTDGLFTNAAKIRQCTIDVKYKHTTYVLENEHFGVIEEVEIEEVKND